MFKNNWTKQIYNHYLNSLLVTYLLCKSIEFPPLVFLSFCYYKFFIFQSTIYRKKAGNALHLLVYLHWTTDTVWRMKRCTGKNNDVFFTTFYYDPFQNNRRVSIFGTTFDSNMIETWGFHHSKEEMNLYRILYFRYFWQALLPS